MKNLCYMKKIIGMLTACLLLFCACGKQTQNSESEKSFEATSTEQSDDTMQSDAEEATHSERRALGIEGAAEAELSAYLWEEFDLAFDYPAMYKVTLEESEGCHVLSANTGNSEDGMMQLAVVDKAYEEETFANMNSNTLGLHLGLNALVSWESSLEDVTMPHLSAVDVQGKKMWVSSCEYDGVPAELTVLAVNCYDTNKCYFIACACTKPEYQTFCKELENHFYLGNCNVADGQVVQEIKEKDLTPKDFPLDGFTICLPAEWKAVELEESEANPGEIAKDEWDFETPQGDYMIVTKAEGVTEEEFQQLMELQYIGKDMGSQLLLKEKEPKTVHGESAYLLRMQQFSGVGHVPVYSWYICKTGTDACLLTVSVMDMSDKQTDFALDIENWLRW